MSLLHTRILFVVLYLVLAPLVGGLLEGLDRKFSARMQGRVGPPLLQPFYDVHKLFNKQTIRVNPAQAFLVQCFCMTQIFTGCLLFAGFDVLMCFFILSTGATFLVFAASVTHSPYSSMGAQRELLQMLAYEPAVLMTCLGFYLASGSFNVSTIANTDQCLILKLPGFFIAFVYALTIKMRKSPFDLSTSHHAHQELVKGVTTEIGSGSLGIYQITEWYENVLLLAVVGLFIINAHGWSIPVMLLVILLVCFFETLTDNCFARVKWNTMLVSTWVVTLLSAGLNLLILMIVK